MEKQELEREYAEILAKLDELPNSKKFIKKKKVVDEAFALNEKKYREAELLEQEHGACIPTVSYTHLDVYKRQE